MLVFFLLSYPNLSYTIFSIYTLPSNNILLYFILMLSIGFCAILVLNTSLFNDVFALLVITNSGVDLYSSKPK